MGAKTAPIDVARQENMYTTELGEGPVLLIATVAKAMYTSYATQLASTKLLEARAAGPTTT